MLPLDLSRPPTTAELMAAGQLGGPLYPTHEVRNPQRASAVNHSFGEAIQAWNRHEYQKALKMFNEHVARFPDSPWASEAVLHVGCDAQFNGRYHEAERCFQWVIRITSHSRHPGARAMLNKARVRMANQKVIQGNFAQAIDYLRTLKQESPDWRDRTYAAHWIQRISLFKGNERAMLNCGTQALAQVLEKNGKAGAAKEVRGLLAPSRRGHSLKDLQSIAAKHGYPMTGRKLTAAQLKEAPLPAILQISPWHRGDLGHYWVLEKVEGDNFAFFEPQSARRFKQNAQELAQEWSGSALVFSKQANLPGVALAEQEIAGLAGGCCGVPMLEGNLGSPDQGLTFGSSEDCGSVKWSVNPINLNFFASDTPLWYHSPIGPSVAIRLSYNSLSALAQNEPFGHKWQFNYGTYLVEDSGGKVTVFMPDGRRDIYIPDGLGGYTSEIQVFNTLTKIGPNHFELRFLDDSVWIYDIPAGTGALQPFLVEIRDPYSQTLTFGYDAQARLTSITDAQGKVTTLTYNGGLVTKVTDPFSRVASFDYDAAGNLTKITDMGGYPSGFTYNQDIFITGIFKPRGTWNIYTEPADGIDNKSSQFPLGNPYPAAGGAMWENSRITITNPLGQKEEYYYYGFQGTHSWHTSPSYYDIRPLGPISPTFCDPEATIYTRRTIYVLGTLNGKGIITMILYPAGLINNEATTIMNLYPNSNEGTEFTYDNRGNITNATGAAQYGVKSCTYNDKGRITSNTVQALGTASFSYAANGVDVTAIHDTLGTIALTYDATHDLTSIIDRLGNNTSFTYNKYGQMTSRTDALGITTNYIYNEIEQTHLLESITRDGLTLHIFSYDPLGRVRTHTGPTGITLTYDYNDLNQITRITFPDGKFVTYTHSGCCAFLLDSATDRVGRTTFYYYDRLERLTRQVLSDGREVSYSYDPDGNLTGLVDPTGKATQFNYDADGRVVAKIYPSGDQETFSYDSLGRLTAKCNARGNINTAGYAYCNPNLGGLVSGPSHGADEYTYDAMGRLTSIGSLDMYSYLWDQYSYSYDANSRLVKMDGMKNSLTYQYDALGRRIALTPVTGQAIIYTYDTLNRPKTINIEGNVYTFGYTGASPLLSSLTRPGGSVTLYQYDGLGRLTDLANKDGAGQIVSRHTYTYNQQDLRASETATLPDPLTPYDNEYATYTYNQANQLTAINTPDLQILDYDQDGNLESGFTPMGYRFHATYDYLNRLRTLTFKDGVGKTVTFAYQYLGNLLKKVTRDEGSPQGRREQYYIYDGLVILQEWIGKSLLSQFTWLNQKSGGVGRLLDLKQGGAHYSYLYDGQGNVTSLLDYANWLGGTLQYDPFGAPRGETGGLSLSLRQPMQFSTKLYDEETGLLYYGHRFYSPTLGRWLTRDPLGEGGGLNLYAFTGNNPVNFFDPHGLILDYLQFSVSFGSWIGWSGRVAADRFGRIYIAGGGGGGKTWGTAYPKDWSLSLVGGHLWGQCDNERKNAAKLKDFMTGTGVSAGGGYVVGANQSFSLPSGDTATEGGFFTPQAGGTVQYQTMQLVASAVDFDDLAFYLPHNPQPGSYVFRPGLVPTASAVGE